MSVGQRGCPIDRLHVFIERVVKLSNPPCQQQTYYPPLHSQQHQRPRGRPKQLYPFNRVQFFNVSCRFGKWQSRTMSY